MPSSADISVRLDMTTMKGRDAGPFHEVVNAKGKKFADFLFDKGFTEAANQKRYAVDNGSTLYSR
jgi:hypothetical protein